MTAEPTNEGGPGEDERESEDSANRRDRIIDHLLLAVLRSPAAAVGKPGRYVDLRDPKKGGMAVVYRAWDVELKREVAYKVMDDLRDSEKFYREAEITAELQYPGIVPVFGRVEDGSRRPAYAMGYIEGINFEDLAKENRPLHERLTIFRAACQIVQFAHSRGYAHCDISLKNLMIASDGATHVVDWGLARRLDGSESRDVPGETFAQQELFTRAFTPPSVLAGNPKTFATDVYGLGAVLAALVKGVTPKGQPDFNGPGGKLAPPAIKAIINEALVDRADGLYPTAGALADDIGRYLAGEKVLAYDEPWVDRFWRLTRTHPTLATFAVSSLLLLMLASISVLLISAAQDRASKKEEEALRRAEEATTSRREAAWSQANEAMLRCSSILGQNPTPELIDSRTVEVLLKALSLLGKKPELPTAKTIESVKSLAEWVRQTKARAEASRREDAESELRKSIAILERLEGEVPDPRYVRYHLVKSYYGLGVLELTRTTNELGLFKFMQITQAIIAGNAPRQPEIENILVKFDKTLELIQLSSPHPSEPELLQEIERNSWMVRGITLARLGRFTECLISFDHALTRVQEPGHTAIQNLRSVFLITAEIEQSHMPWSNPPHVDHPKAIEMADYLVGQPQTSPEAIFNGACAFSLASQDEREDDSERERRAKRAVALLCQIEGKHYFRVLKKTKELREDKALDPLRSREDFKALVARVAEGE